MERKKKKVNTLRNILTIVEMKSKSLRLVGVIASKGHICYLGKPINGSCKIGNGRVWKTELSWTSEMYTTGCMGTGANGSSMAV